MSPHCLSGHAAHCVQRFAEILGSLKTVRVVASILLFPMPLTWAAASTALPSPETALGSSAETAVHSPVQMRAPAGMVSIPGASFSFGASKLHPDGGTRVTIAGYRLDATEVTVADYASCVGAGGCSVPHDDWHTCTWGARSEHGSHPVNCVSWSQAAGYCAWARKRLPTEQEWEYAARGGDERTYPWGEDAPSDQACWDETSTCSVGSHPAGASPFGAQDMSGNVWEWTATPAPLPQGAEGYVLRGGGWERDPVGERSGIEILERLSLFRDDYASDVGFRCACDANAGISR